MDDIFEGIPILKNNDELNEFKKQFDPNKTDEYYLASGADQDRRAFMNKLYDSAKNYIDSKGRSQSKVDFGGFAWELYIFNLLDNMNLEFESKDSGPDALILNPSKFYVECISIAEDKTISIPRNGAVIDVPQDQILAKLTGAIWNKKKQRDEFIKKGRIDKSLPYVIAINSGALVFPQKYGTYPLILQGLIGIHNMCSNADGDFFYKFRDKLSLNGKEIPLKPFSDGSYDGISGVIICDTNVISLRNQAEQIYFIPNPTCKNPLDRNIFKPLKNVRLNETNFNLCDKPYIFLDLVNTLYDPKFGIDNRITEIIDKYDAQVVIVTNTTKQNLNKMDRLPYMIYTMEGNPRKEDISYFKSLMKKLVLDPSDILYIEHNLEVVKLAKSLGIKTLHYDKDKKDYAAITEFLKKHLFSDGE